jgi:hypothetical protein
MASSILADIVKLFYDRFYYYCWHYRAGLADDWLTFSHQRFCNLNLKPFSSYVYICLLKLIRSKNNWCFNAYLGPYNIQTAWKRGSGMKRNMFFFLCVQFKYFRAWLTKKITVMSYKVWTYEYTEQMPSIIVLKYKRIFVLHFLSCCNGWRQHSFKIISVTTVSIKVSEVIRTYYEGSGYF